MAGQGGYVATGLRSLIGSPSIGYVLDEDELQEHYSLIVAGEAAGYIMGLGTAGNGNDQEENSCGIAMSHAYSLIAPFEMTGSDGTVHQMLMVRNPWGLTQYTGTWSQEDANWTDDLVGQVPYNIDPRTSGDSDGIFVTPLEDLAACFNDMSINHHRDDEGYSDTWFDAIDMDEAEHVYKFTVPADAQI